MERKGEVISSIGAEDGKGTETNCGKFGTQHLETENIRCRRESKGGLISLPPAHLVWWQRYQWYRKYRTEKDSI